MPTSFLVLRTKRKTNSLSYLFSRMVLANDFCLPFLFSCAFLLSFLLGSGERGKEDCSSSPPAWGGQSAGPITHPSAWYPTLWHCDCLEVGILTIKSRHQWESSQGLIETLGIYPLKMLSWKNMKQEPLLAIFSNLSNRPVFSERKWD